MALNESVLFCFVESVSYDMRGTMLSPDMSITDEELEVAFGCWMKISGELVYKDVENTFIEAELHEAAASGNFH